MSEVRLNIIDTNDAIHGTTHGAVADAVVAALSAEPETIAELEAALQRFIKPVEDDRPFAWFHAGANEEPWDAGIVVVDLAARIVAAESSYSSLRAQGDIQYHDGARATDVSLLYRVPDDWVFVYSLDEYKSARNKRRAQRADAPPLDAREVLYGPAMVEFIVNECLAARGSADCPVCADGSERDPLQTRQSTVRQSAGPQSSSSLGGSGRLGGFARNATDPQSVGPQSAIDNPQSENAIAEIHARWLMTPRADLRGQTPREVMLAKLDFIDFDLHTRELQWSLLGEGPPPLARDSYAYRFAGFGTHEYVLYYALLRHLLSECLDHLESEGRVDSARQRVAKPSVCVDQGWLHAEESASLNPQSAIRNPQSEVAWLEELKQAWLNEPNEDFDGRIPSAIIESERRRIPMVMSAKQMMIDENCDVCRLMAGETGEDFGPGFWHLDGCNMDEGFEFSTYRIREEWEEEQRRWKEFNEDFNRKWAQEHGDNATKKWD